MDRKVFTYKIGAYDFLVDEEDVPLIGQYHWTATKPRNHVYAICTRNQKNIRLHRLLVNAPASAYVDHINGNTLDNRRANLRVCTPGQNMANSRLSSNNRTGFKGVGWNARKQRFRAQIECNGKRHFLGYFKDPMSSHEAYMAKARELFGEFANDGTPCGKKVLE